MLQLCRQEVRPAGHRVREQPAWLRSGAACIPTTWRHVLRGPQRVRVGGADQRSVLQAAAGGHSGGALCHHRRRASSEWREDAEPINDGAAEDPDGELLQCNPGGGTPCRPGSAWPSRQTHPDRRHVLQGAAE